MNTLLLIIQITSIVSIVSIATFKQNTYNNIVNIKKNLIQKLNLNNINNKNVNNNELVFTNNLYESFQFKKVRILNYITKNVEFLNIVWCPTCDYKCPILTFDFFNFRKNQSYCLIRYKEIYETNDYKKLYIHPLDKIINNYPDIENIKIKNNKNTLLYVKVNDIDILENIIHEYMDTYFLGFIKRPVDRYYIENIHDQFIEKRKVLDKQLLTNQYFDKELYYNII